MTHWTRHLALYIRGMTDRHTLMPNALVLCDRESCKTGGLGFYEFPHDGDPRNVCECIRSTLDQIVVPAKRKQTLAA